MTGDALKRECQYEVVMYQVKRMLRVGFISLPQRYAVRGDEILILTHGKRQDLLSVFISYRLQFYYHDRKFSLTVKM